VRLVRLAICAWVAVAMAACSGAAPQKGAAVATVDATSGGVQGTVTDDSILPLKGVKVVLDEHLENVTSVDGGFSFLGIVPGSYVLRANATGFVEGKTKVEVRAGEITKATLVLRPRTADTPYHVIMQKAGLVGCAVNSPEGNTVTVLANCETFFIAGMHDIDNYILPFHVGSLERIVGFWSETTFHSSQALGRTMQVRWTMSETSQPAQNTYFLYPIAIKTGPSPVRYGWPIKTVVDNITSPLKSPSDMCSLKDCWLIDNNYAGNDSVTLLPTHFGVMVQQRFEQYLALFYNGDFPAEFVIAPDE
jgi:hypothetical protein